MELTRRSFLGAATIGAGLAMAGLAGCAAPAGKSEGGAAEAAAVPANIAETVDCDIAVVGSGAAGLAACVEAAQNGAHVLCLERNNFAGGNANLTRCIFGIGSSMEKAQGEEADAGEFVRMELESSQCRGSGPAIVDLAEHSGENIDWLMDNGVVFECLEHGTAHSFTGAPAGGNERYVTPMLAACDKLGVEIRLKTCATSLIQDESGAVIGLYADGPDGAIQVNAKAVILAGGGFVENADYMQDFGIDLSKSIQLGNPGHDGSTIQMALDAGAKSNMKNAGFQLCMQVDGLPPYTSGGLMSSTMGDSIPMAVWVNQDCKRFVNEDCCLENWAMADMTTMGNDETYLVWDSRTLDAFVEYVTGNGATEDEVMAEFEQGLDAGEIVQADTLEEAADTLGIDADALRKTIDQYNAFAEAGVDSHYGKGAEFLWKIENAPFTIIRSSHLILCSFAGVCTDLDYRALRSTKEPIPGLYAVGNDGAMLWASEYTIWMPGGTNACNVHSGRTAARHAASNL
ncbi:FAD-dependent oxidoreductase [Rubneribacter sp.]|nr:FAD-binding protein [Candidatus Rubneribacter avistercoris]